MKKKVLFALTSTFLLASCQSEAVSEPTLSSEEVSSFESSIIESEPIESSEPDDGLDEIFLTLEDNLKPFFKGDKNGLKINPVGDDPMFKITFKTDNDISLSTLDDSSLDESEPENGISSYTIELNCEESTIETFNRTKKRGYSNRMTFQNAEISVVREGTHVIDLNQTYVGYLAQTEIAGTDPKEYENGLYVDLSKATLSRVTFAPLFDKLILPAKNYYNVDSLYDGLENIFPMSTTMNALLPTAVDMLKREVRNGVLTLEKDTTKPIEEYKIHREIESKQAMLDTINQIVDEALEEGNLDIERQDIDDAIDAIFGKMQSISGDFEINFNENEFVDMIVDFNIELDDLLSEGNDLGVYFNINEFVISGKLTLMDPADVDYSTYPTNLTNRNVWKELTLTA